MHINHVLSELLSFSWQVLEWLWGAKELWTPEVTAFNPHFCYSSCIIQHYRGISLHRMTIKDVKLSIVVSTGTTSSTWASQCPPPPPPPKCSLYRKAQISCDLNSVIRKQTGFLFLFFPHHGCLTWFAVTPLRARGSQRTHESTGRMVYIFQELYYLWNKSWHLSNRNLCNHVWGKFGGSRAIYGS